MTAAAFLATVDDPERFRRSSSVGAYFGLTPRRCQSGDIDYTGRISKRGDGLMRSYLFEAANVLLTRVSTWSTLRAWGMRLAKRDPQTKCDIGHLTGRQAVRRTHFAIAAPMSALVPPPSQRDGQFLLDQLFDEAPDPIPDPRLDRVRPSFPQKQRLPPSCYRLSWRDLRRRDNAGPG